MPVLMLLPLAALEDAREEEDVAPLVVPLKMVAEALLACSGGARVEAVLVQPTDKAGVARERSTERA
eukprot:768741-Hanusia_phi.AAC.5